MAFSHYLSFLSLLLSQSDGLTHTKLLARKHCNEALSHISILADSVEKRALMSVIEKVLERSKWTNTRQLFIERKKKHDERWILSSNLRQNRETWRRETDIFKSKTESWVKRCKTPLRVCDTGSRTYRSAPLLAEKDSLNKNDKYH